MRYAQGTQITPANVRQLAATWTFHTGAIAKMRPGTADSSFEATPILFHGQLYVTSPFDEIFALDPATGKQRWMYDPKTQSNVTEGILTSRGVAAWASVPANASSPCDSRIFVATMDAKLIAVDAETGSPCIDFGNAGAVDLSQGVYFKKGDAYYNSSPPTVIGNLVVVGSAIADNQRVDNESGVVRAYDCVTGHLIWSWDPIPWASHAQLRTGAANAWSVIAADLEHGLLYIPTGSPSPDFYGGKRPGDEGDANSVVALEAATGRRVWGFKVVHHDLWDYDVAAEPLLFTFRGTTPAIAITTKQGLVFVLNRLTGEPLFPIIERRVPASDVPGEFASPTQPFQQIDTLSPIEFPVGTTFGDSPEDDEACRKQFAALRYEGIYTPPTLRGSLNFPGNLGGVNWGGASFDPVSGTLYANTNRSAFSVELSRRHGPFYNGVQLHAKYVKNQIAAGALLVAIVLLLFGCLWNRSLRPGKSALSLFLIVLLAGSLGYWHTRYQPGERFAEHFGREFGTQFGTPYTVLRQQLIAPASRHPCTPEPWGTVSALNLNTGKTVWQTPLGTLIDGKHTGTVNLGGNLVTASGLVFTGASVQPLLRAFDAANGQELWQGNMPAPAQSTPMSYTVDGRQYIVIAAGGHGLFGTPIADTLVAYALPRLSASDSTQHLVKE